MPAASEAATGVAALAAPAPREPSLSGWCTAAFLRYARASCDRVTGSRGSRPSSTSACRTAAVLPPIRSLDWAWSERSPSPPKLLRLSSPSSSLLHALACMHSTAACCMAGPKPGQPGAKACSFVRHSKAANGSCSMLELADSHRGSAESGASCMARAAHCMVVQVRDAASVHSVVLFSSNLGGCCHAQLRGCTSLRRVNKNTCTDRWHGRAHRAHM